MCVYLRLNSIIHTIQLYWLQIITALYNTHTLVQQTTSHRDQIKLGRLFGGGVRPLVVSQWRCNETCPAAMCSNVKVTVPWSNCITVELHYNYNCLLHQINTHTIYLLQCSLWTLTHTLSLPLAYTDVYLYLPLLCRPVNTFFSGPSRDVIKIRKEHFLVVQRAITVKRPADTISK